MSLPYIMATYVEGAAHVIQYSHDAVWRHSDRNYALQVFNSDQTIPNECSLGLATPCPLPNACVAGEHSRQRN